MSESNAAWTMKPTPEEERSFLKAFEPAPLPETPRQKLWRQLKEAIPDLGKIEPRQVNHARPPNPISDQLLLALAAGLLDDTKRDVIKGIIMEAIKEDIVAIVNSFLTDEPK